MIVAKECHKPLCMLVGCVYNFNCLILKNVSCPLVSLFVIEGDSYSLVPNTTRPSLPLVAIPSSSPLVNDNTLAEPNATLVTTRNGLVEAAVIPWCAIMHGGTSTDVVVSSSTSLTSTFNSSIYSTCTPTHVPLSIDVFQESEHLQVLFD
jgi:hypothetical protein